MDSVRYERTLGVGGTCQKLAAARSITHPVAHRSSIRYAGFSLKVTVYMYVAILKGGAIRASMIKSEDADPKMEQHTPNESAQLCVTPRAHAHTNRRCDSSSEQEGGGGERGSSCSHASGELLRGATFPFPLDVKASWRMLV